MASASDNIRDLIQKLAQTGDEMYSVVGEVSEVDETARTCTVQPANGTAKIIGCRLQSGIDSESGFVMVPKDGSNVVVSFLNKDAGFVTLMDEVDKIIIDCDDVAFNGGDNGGLVISGETASKLNDIENKVNSILNTLKGVTVPLAPTGSYPFAPLFASITDLANTSASDLENDKIKH